MSLKHLKAFQVNPDRVDRQEIINLVNKTSTSSKVSEIQVIFDQNISLCAYMLKYSYIDYHDIYFLSTSLILEEDNRPDYLCVCNHPKKGISCWAIIFAGPQEQVWDDDLQLTAVAKQSFDRLNYCTGNLSRILVANKLFNLIDSELIYGLLIIGQDRDFFENSRKQERKRNVNRNSRVKLRTYGAFIRKHDRHKERGWLINAIDDLVDKFKNLD